MFGKCTRKLVFRWCLMAFTISAIVMFTLYRVGQINLDSSDPTWLSESFDFLFAWSLPRFLDPLLMTLPFAFLAWWAFDAKLIQKRWGTDPRGIEPVSSWALSVGIVFGLIGTFFVLATTIYVVVVMAFIVGGVYACFATEASFIKRECYSSHSVPGNWRFFALELNISITMLAALTLVLGFIPASIIAGLLLAVSALSHFGIWAICRLYRMSWPSVTDGFRRTMLRCE